MYLDFDGGTSGVNTILPDSLTAGARTAVSFRTRRYLALSGRLASKLTRQRATTA